MESSKRVIMRICPYNSRKDKGRTKKNISGEATSQDEKKKDIMKVKRFPCHKFGHYASQCLNNKKGKGKAQQVVAIVGTQVREFATKFE